MRDAEKTVGTMIDKQKTAFIGSIDSEGFPNIKAMLQPRNLSCNPPKKKKQTNKR